MKKNRFRFTLFGFSLLMAMLLWTGCFISRTVDGVYAWAACITHSQDNKPIPTAHFSQQNPASIKPILTWTKIKGAVAYELELLSKASDTQNQLIPFFSTKQIYVNGFNADLSGYSNAPSFYWRVRGLDIDGAPISPFSDPELTPLDRKQAVAEKPTITSFFNQSPGATLLYPVYSWIPLAGAERYEVEILDDLPENPNGITPSVHRIDAAIAIGFDYYDQKPRISEDSFYWRVRGLDQAGNPVGVYSDVGKFNVSPKQHVAVATFGDSITHGGGSVSYSPADWEYSYQHYLSFPTINLGRSGDTSSALAERFEQDVLPFQPQYLLILAGTNSLRGGILAESVIADLISLKEKCIANNIRPVFLTLPPVNPDNIKKVFNEPTAPDWQKEMNLVNNFIRKQVYIDISAEMKYGSGILPANVAVDGLHLDIEGKKKIAAIVNANWTRITESSWKNAAIN